MLVLLHNGGFCNGFITKRSLHNSINASCNDHICSMINYESNKKSHYFCHFLNTIGFLIKGKFASTKSVL
jgi:hypothetical protein